MVYLWTCDTFVYYGLSLFSTQLAGDRFLNFALMGLIEIPSYLVSPMLLNRMGRRVFVSVCHLLAAASFFAIAWVGTDKPGLSLLMWLMGKFAISCAFTSLFVYSSEVFPTVARNGCIGICSGKLEEHRAA
jgi:OCT family organic cation transporter-like MFS transporter 4/5